MSDTTPYHPPHAPNPELTMTTKIECPSCGQHYSLELGDEKVTLTCPKCDAEFTAQKEIEVDSPKCAPMRVSCWEFGFNWQSNPASWISKSQKG